MNVWTTISFFVPVNKSKTNLQQQTKSSKDNKQFRMLFFTHFLHTHWNSLKEAKQINQHEPVSFLIPQRFMQQRKREKENNRRIRQKTWSKMSPNSQSIAINKYFKSIIYSVKRNSSFFFVLCRIVNSFSLHFALLFFRVHFLQITIAFQFMWIVSARNWISSRNPSTQTEKHRCEAEKRMQKT